MRDKNGCGFEQWFLACVSHDRIWNLFGNPLLTISLYQTVAFWKCSSHHLSNKKKNNFCKKWMSKENKNRYNSTTACYWAFKFCRSSSYINVILWWENEEKKKKKICLPVWHLKKMTLKSNHQWVKTTRKIILFIYKDAYCPFYDMIFILWLALH